MPLRFRNDTSLTLEVAIAYNNQNCTGSKWRKEGWWQIPPRGKVTVFTGPTKNEKFFYFARSTNNAHTWSGNFTTGLPSEAFSRCWDESGGTVRGLRKIMATANDYTVPLYI